MSARMDSPALHVALRGEHVLLSSVTLDSAAGLGVAALMTVFVCLAERALTFAGSKHWTPCRAFRRSRTYQALWRAALFWLVTIFRLAYMLVAMTLHTGLILTAVTTLAAAQFLIEFHDARDHAPSDGYTSIPSESYALKQPLFATSLYNLNSTSALDLDSPPVHAHHRSPPPRHQSLATYLSSPPAPRSPSARAQIPTRHSQYAEPFRSPTAGPSPPSDAESSPSQYSPSSPPPPTRPRSRSKPTAIFIHPSQSNLARADATALELGLGGATERVSVAGYTPRDSDAWEPGKGRDVARALLMGSARSEGVLLEDE